MSSNSSYLASSYAHIVTQDSKNSSGPPAQSLELRATVRTERGLKTEKKKLSFDPFTAASLHHSFL